MLGSTRKAGRPKVPAADRILRVASEMFYLRGIRAVGVDAIASEADVTKKTLYDNFGSKDNLVAAYLRGRDERWRGLDHGTTSVFLQATTRRVSCPEHGMVLAAVPWARPGRGSPLRSRTPARG